MDIQQFSSTEHGCKESSHHHARTKVVTQIAAFGQVPTEHTVTVAHEDTTQTTIQVTNQRHHNLIDVRQTKWRC